MGRAHIEFVKDGELDWRKEELTDRLSPFENKLLSIDTETGAFSRVVRMDEDWKAESVTFPSVQELYVLKGELTMDGCQLGPDCYLRIPDGIEVDQITPRDRCRVLWTSDCALDADGTHNDHRFWEQPEDDLTVIDTTEMSWQGTEKEGPDDGLMVKYLWEDEETGAVSFLARAEEWTEPRQEHHDCVETSYTLAGGMKMGDRGTMTKGDYFWRPPWVRHGPMEPVEAGFEAFLRVDGHLENHYTSVKGVPLNY